MTLVYPVANLSPGEWVFASIVRLPDESVAYGSNQRRSFPSSAFGAVMTGGQLEMIGA